MTAINEDTGDSVESTDVQAQASNVAELPTANPDASVSDSDETPDESGDDSPDEGADSDAE